MFYAKVILRKTDSIKDNNIMKDILKILKKYRLRLVFVAFLYALQTCCALFLSYEVGNIVTYGIAESDMPYIIKSGALMTGVTVLSFLTGILLSKINAENSTMFIRDLQQKMFAKINSLSSEEFNSIGAGGLITRSTDDIFHLQWVVNGLIYSIVSIPILFIGGTVLTIIKDWLLGIAMIVAAPIILLIVVLVARNMDELWDLSDKYIDIQNSAVRERLSGIRVIRSFDTEEREHQRISKATELMAKYIIKANVRSGSISSICTFMLDVVALAIVALSFPRVGAGVTAAGDVVSALQYVSLSANGLLMLSWTIMGLPHMNVCVKRISEVFDFKGEPVDPVEKQIERGDVHMKDVTYFYPDSQLPALEHVDFDVNEGEIVGIIGATGSGKSTIVKLLLRFVSPTCGEIEVGGRKYSECGIKESRTAFSTALQKSMIFEGSVRENIGFGNSEATLDDIKEACDIAMIADFIESQPEKYDYRLAKLGTNVSGGQKQRIAIARALIKNAPIYVFDDSFSALDYLTESKLRSKLNAKLKGKTQIIVTQRSATAMHCDKIYVIDKGCIVGFGKHDDLMKSCEIYKEIYNSQHGGNVNEKN